MDHPVEAVSLGKSFNVRSRHDRGILSPIKSLLPGGEKRMEVLRSLTLRVRKGEVYGLLGTNGAGKTTLLRILAGSILQDSGEARIEGLDTRDPSNKDALARSVGLILGDRARSFYLRLTARQNLEFFADLYDLGRKEREERIELLLSKVGLEERKDDNLMRFSTGMINRLSIARAFLHSPSVLLFDEFMANIDPKAAHDMRIIIKDLAKSEGRTVLFTSHDAFGAESLGERFGFLHGGAILAEGTADDLKKEHAGDLSSVRLVFDSDPPPGLLDSLRKLEGVSDASARRGSLILSTSEPGRAVEHALEDASLSGRGLRNIEVLPPSLESVFLGITRRDAP